MNQETGCIFPSAHRADTRIRKARRRRTAINSRMSTLFRRRRSQLMLAVLNMYLPSLITRICISSVCASAGGHEYFLLGCLHFLSRHGSAEEARVHLRGGLTISCNALQASLQANGDWHVLSTCVVTFSKQFTPSWL